MNPPKGFCDEVILFDDTRVCDAMVNGSSIDDVLNSQLEKGNSFGLPCFCIW